MRNSTLMAIAINLLISVVASSQTHTDPALPHSQGAVQPVPEDVIRVLDQVDPPSIKAAIKKLEEQQEQLMLEEAGARGRRRGIEEAVDRYTAMTQKRADDDPVVAELERVISFREQELKRLDQLQKVGAVSPSELNAAETSLANSRVELASAKQRAAGGTSASEALDNWNREAINLSIDEMDRQARLDYIAARLQKLNKVDQDIRDLESAKANDDVNALISRLKSDYADLSSTSDQPTTRPTRP